jgi:hypothetical protein
MLASLALMAGILIPSVGVVSATAPSTTCPDSEGITCYLVISAPASVQTGVAFTVTVFVMTASEGGNIAKTDPCGAKAMVTLSVDNDLDPPMEDTIAAKAGIARFKVTLPTDGSWQLHATAFNDGPGCGESVYFDDDYADILALQPLAPCPTVFCVQTTSGSGSGATLFADSGEFTDFFFSSLSSLGTAGCGDTGPADTEGVLTFSYNGSGPKTIVFTLNSELVTKGIGLYKICWSTDGITFGYLSNCSKSVPAPCVLFKNSGQYNVGFFGVLAPSSGLGDPQGYPK